MSTPIFWKSRVSNWILGAALIGVMVALSLLVGWILLGRLGVVLAIGFLAYNLLQFPVLTTRRVMRSFGAQPITLYEAPELWRLFQKLTESAGLPNMVELYYLPTATPNAFAVGSRGNAAVCVSDGILRIMNARELAGILAHELTHVRNHDTRIMGLAQVIGQVNAILSRIGLLLIVLGIPTFWAGSGQASWLLAGLLLMGAPLIALLLQLALSRSREFQADLGAAEITRDPLGLASALAKLEQLLQRGSWFQRHVDPREALKEPTWLRTHPPTAERIRRLQELHQELAVPDHKVTAAESPIEFHRAPAPARPRQFYLGGWR